MIDLTETIAPKSNQLNADDLIAGPRTIVITDVTKASTEQPIAIRYEGDNNKPYYPCKSMRRVLVQAWGKDGALYKGRSMTLFRDATVTWAGAEVGGIRISHLSDIKEKLVLSITLNQKTRKPYVVLPLGTSKPVKTVDVASLQEKAAGVALGGSDALKTWFTGLSNEEKLAMKPHMEGYKAEAEKHTTSIIGE